jgi:U3 small nucleolar RNA-associated protein 25
VLNHILTSRSRIQRHNHCLKELAKTDETRLAAQGKFRDQGYTRPTVLILLPTRGTCYAFVKGMMHLLGETQVDNLDRFEAEFGAPPPPEEEDATDPAAERRRKMVLEQKGKEWLELFGDDVNDDDDFKIGISLTPKTARTSKQEGNGQQDEFTNVSMRLFTDFYKSDIILASPLALKLLSATSDSEDADYDFLSSIEICILARMDVLLMQNMDHVTSVMSLLNQQPKKNTHDIDFSRVREYCLAGQAAQWRQLIVCSNIIDPQILSIFKRYAKSYEGAVKLKRIVTSEDCSIAKVIVPIQQVFQRVPCTSLADQGVAKLKYFFEKLLPPILQRKQKHTMIFVPSYFDFISLRNVLLKREDVDFVSVSEYSRISEVSRSRARFLQGLKPILLYTGRAHYFNRHTIKGVKHLIFFGLPEQSEFYVDLIHALGEGFHTKSQHQHDDDLMEKTSMTCLALFTKYDAHALERIAGRDDCRKMLKSDKTAFAFTSS